LPAFQSEGLQTIAKYIFQSRCGLFAMCDQRKLANQGWPCEDFKKKIKITHHTQVKLSTEGY